MKKINGIRIVDKLKSKQNNNVRFEIWFNYSPCNKDPHTDATNKQIEKYLTELYQKHRISEISFVYQNHNKWNIRPQNFYSVY